MNSQHRLIERQEPPYRLPVRLSKSLSRMIANIKHSNDIERYKKWRFEHIGRLVKFISEPSTAFDYANRAYHNSDGTICNGWLGYEIEYMIKSNKANTIAYVYVINMDFALEEFGLSYPTIPEAKSRNTIVINETKLRQIVRETLREILYN